MKKVSPVVLPALLFIFGLLISYWFSHLQFESQTDRLREHIGTEIEVFDDKSAANEKLLPNLAKKLRYRAESVKFHVHA